MSNVQRKGVKAPRPYLLLLHESKDGKLLGRLELRDVVLRLADMHCRPPVLIPLRKRLELHVLLAARCLGVSHFVSPSLLYACKFHAFHRLRLGWLRLGGGGSGFHDDGAGWGWHCGVRLEVPLHVDDDGGRKDFRVTKGQCTVVRFVWPGCLDDWDVELVNRLGNSAKGAIVALVNQLLQHFFIPSLQQSAV